MTGHGFDIDRPRESQDTFRDSLELSGAAHTALDDQAILDEHEEAERLLRGSQPAVGKLQRFFGVGDEDQHIGEKERGRSSRTSHDAAGRLSREEALELMHDMDDSADRSSGESSEGSFDLDREKLAKKHRLRTSKKSLCARFAGIHIVILIALAALLYGAYRASQKTKVKPYVAQALSNGTSIFQPTTILISLDGFRADFLNRNLTPHLNQLVSAGVSPEYMLPSFPSVTFPNHFTLVTGLYPESHSVVGNTFWDPALHEEFYYTDPARSQFPRFWLANPIWAAAEAAGIRSAIHMWPGSEAHIGAHEPTYVDKFNSKEPLDAKVDRILGLLDVPGPDSSAVSETSPRPQLIAAYVPNVDADGHKYGPNSTEIRGTIAAVDSMIGNLMAGLDARNLSKIVNVIVVSDHGMATTSTNRLIQLEDVLDVSQIEHTDGWPLYGLRPKADVDHLALHAQLKASATKFNGSFEVYHRDIDMPARYHFSNNPRIAPLWLVPAPGWAFTTRAEFDIAAAKKEGKTYHPRGLHGYDHEHPLMRAIFIARGPAFPHPPGSRMNVFQNVEVYGLVCDSLGLQHEANNGTLRLPLKTNGLHKNVGLGAEVLDLPADDLPGHDGEKEEGKHGWDGLGELPLDGDGNVATSSTAAFSAPVAASTVPISATHGIASGTSAAAEVSSTSTSDLDPELEKEKASALSDWWKWFIGQVESVKTWASGKLTSHKGDGEGGEDNAAPDRPAVVQVDEPAL
ncbi:Phosphodiest-domain-containing protein [Myriangium duriaei CBS 260.36]|uniref:Phosphodiest-domain-containing protein n=1 Tax=Myriangium duriaei CBS 260.36 TaxID=1168546 RepID=A0A9P4MFP8_9PEZI|nr:Phosphodiest-domain-containing protein [Myriangium duriaei CBS 260.36]